MKLKFGKYGLLDDPRGGHCTFNIGPRKYLVEVTSVYRAEVRGITMLRTKHFNGEPGPDVAAATIDMLERTRGGQK